MSTLDNNQTPLDGGTGSSTSTFADILATLGTILKAIPLFGNLFRGSTKHVPYDTGVEKSNAIASEIIKVYDKFTSDIPKRLMWYGAKTYYENDVLGRFRGWWDGIMEKDYALWQARGWLSSEREQLYHYISQPAFYFMTLEDVERLEETFPERFTSRVNAQVLKPVEKYMTVSASGDSPSLGNDVPGAASQAGIFNFSSTTTKWLLLGGGALAAVYFFMKGK